MESCWRKLLSLCEEYLPKWLVSHDDCVRDNKPNKKFPQQPEIQQLFQTADQETDRTVTLTGPKNYQVVRLEIIF